MDYDLFVIGAGSGGVRAARIAATHGAKVAIAEDRDIGGTCVVRGCVPKKLFVYASRYAEEFSDAAGFGWHVSQPTFNWSQLRDAVQQEVKRLSGIYHRNLEKAGVTIFQQRAVVHTPTSVQLADGTVIHARKILIATGAKPNIDPHLPGREHVLVSDDLFHLPALPSRVAIAGGGYIALEFASLLKGLGVDVTVVYRGEAVLRGFDEDVRQHVQEEMQKRGVKFIFNTVFSHIEKNERGLTASLTSGHALAVDVVLFAIGRSPHADLLGLEQAGVKRDAHGAIIVDATSRTAVPSIFAVGDVTNRANLTPVAIREGHAFADSEFGGKPWIVDHSQIPTAVFTSPEVGTVGLTEAEARRRGEVDIYRTRFRPMKATISQRDERVLMKLVVAQDSQKVLGVHVVGESAAEMIQMAGIAVKMGATKQQFDATIAVHPTAAEELVTLREKI